MADLATIFGSAIKVGVQPRQSERQYAGFPGAHGVTTMAMGTRGRQLVITGTFYQNGENYAAARAALQTAIDAIEAYLYAAAADYTYGGQTYYNVVFDKLSLVPDQQGKFFHWNAGGYVTVKFVCYGRCLI